MWGLLLDVTASDDDRIKSVVSGIQTIASIGLSLVVLGVLVLAIWLGYKMATAEDDAKRKNAKAQLIYAIVGVVGAIAVVILFDTVVVGNLKSTLTKQATKEGFTDLVNAVNSVMSIFMGFASLLTVAITYFAIYLAYKMVTAEDDSKRKNAKGQLIYAIIGVVVIVALMVFLPSIITNISFSPTQTGKK
ncbi:MAG: pilin [Christensenellaceae bacterium]|jgi:multisubunit Na+/H+ antiporter MnhB subunit|nr:pilin [Christensenellaceae bacterium]